MKEFVLPKTGGIARCSILDENDLADVIALHDETRAALPEDKKRFILPQGPSYFQNLLGHTTGIMIGIRTEGRLVAQMALMGPMPMSEAIALQIITHNDIPFHHAALTDDVIVFKSMASLPSCRGNELAKNLVLFALELPFTQICDHLFAQISTGNKRSWNVFVQNKFGIVGADYDPDDGLPRFVFQRPAFDFDFVPDVIADEVDPADDFPAIVQLTQREGLIGIYETGSTDKLAFFRNREEVPLAPRFVRASAKL